MRAFVNGAFEDIESGRVRVGNAWKNLASVRVYAGGAWREGKTFVPPMSLAIAPDDAFGSVSTPVSTTATTNSVTATPTGGLAPYTYAWVRLTGTGSANSATSAATTFSASVGPGDSLSGDFQCTVTDSAGGTATAAVTAIFVNFDLGF